MLCILHPLHFVSVNSLYVRTILVNFVHFSAFKHNFITNRNDFGVIREVEKKTPLEF